MEVKKNSVSTDIQAMVGRVATITTEMFVCNEVSKSYLFFLSLSN